MKKKKSKHVSCKFDKFGVDGNLCKLRGVSNFANTMEELIDIKYAWKYAEVSVVSLSFTFPFEIVPTTTVAVGSTHTQQHD